MRSALVLITSLAAAACVGACADDGAPVCQRPVPGTLEIGLGDATAGYEPMAQGARVPIVLGPQGLHMIVMSVRAIDFEANHEDGAPYRVSLAVEHDGMLIGGTVDTLQPTSRAGSTLEFLGLRAPFGVAEVRPLDGVTVSVSATVDDGCERRVASASTVILSL